MKSLCLILFLALGASPACSRFTASGRQERAYAKYLRKSSGNRERQTRVRHRAPKMPNPDTMAPSEPRERTKTSEGSQPVPSDPDNQ
jgi:hypothetical protein